MGDMKGSSIAVLNGIETNIESLDCSMVTDFRKSADFWDEFSQRSRPESDRDPCK